MCDFRDPKELGADVVRGWAALARLGIGMSSCMASAITGAVERARLNPDEGVDICWMRLHKALTEALGLESQFFRWIDHRFPPVFENKLHRRVVSFAKMPEPELVRCAVKQINTSYPTWESMGLEEDYFYVKINHGFWEHIAEIGMYVHGLPYYCANLTDKLEKYQVLYSRLMLRGLSTLLAPCLRAPAAVGSLDFAISYTEGRRSNAEVLAAPGRLAPTTRGAIVGAMAWVEALAGDRPAFLSDGGMPRRIVEDGSITVTMGRLIQASDAVVFVVPAHLAGIALVQPGPPTHVIIQPRYRTFAVWPTLLAALTGRILALTVRYQRVTVFIQAGVFAPFLGAILARLRQMDSRPTASVLRFFDLGQVLDLAARGEPHAGYAARGGVGLPEADTGFPFHRPGSAVVADWVPKELGDLEPKPARIEGALYRRALRTTPAHPSAWRARAALIGRHGPAGAMDLAFLAAAMAREPDSAAVLHDRANGLHLAGQETRALVLQRRALAIDPAHGPARRQWAVALAAREDWAKAQAVARAAVMVAPRDALAWLFLGLAAQRQNQRMRAVGALERAFFLDPGLTLARQLLARMVPGDGQRRA